MRPQLRYAWKHLKVDISLLASLKLPPSYQGTGAWLHAHSHTHIHTSTCLFSGLHGVNGLTRVYPHSYTSPQPGTYTPIFKHSCRQGSHPYLHYVYLHTTLLTQLAFPGGAHADTAALSYQSWPVWGSTGCRKGGRTVLYSSSSMGAQGHRPWGKGSC